MSTEQRRFIRNVWIIVITALVMQIIVGFGILNRDHFTIKSNNEKIMEVLENQKQKVSYSAFNEAMKAFYDYNEVTRQMLEAHQQYDVERFQRLETQMHTLQQRIDRIFETYGVGTVRGSEFEIDVMPEIFKQRS